LSKRWSASLGKHALKSGLKCFFARRRRRHCGFGFGCGRGCLGQQARRNPIFENALNVVVVYLSPVITLEGALIGSYTAHKRAGGGEPAYGLRGR